MLVQKREPTNGVPRVLHRDALGNAAKGLHDGVQRPTGNVLHAVGGESVC